MGWLQADAQGTEGDQGAEGSTSSILWAEPSSLPHHPILPSLSPFCVCPTGALAPRSVCRARSRRVYIGKCSSLGALPSQLLIICPGPSTIPAFLIVLFPEGWAGLGARVRKFSLVSKTDQPIWAEGEGRF